MTLKMPSSKLLNRFNRLGRTEDDVAAVRMKGFGLFYTGSEVTAVFIRNGLVVTLEKGWAVAEDVGAGTGRKGL